MAGGGGGELFGQILFLKNQSGTIVFICVLLIFTLFEGILHVLEVECNKRGFKGLIKKLYREFMIMGFISFAILLATETSNSPEGEWYDSFHFAHIVLLFIGITFLLQAALLTSLIHMRNRILLAHDNASSEQLIMQYIDLQKAGGFMALCFDYGPVSIPVPELREKIEFKIIQEFFIRNYNLPAEFRFANYMCMVLKEYILDLVEVRPISWLLLSVFVAINYARIGLIDPVYESDVCERYPNDDLDVDDGAHRRLQRLLAGSGDDDKHPAEGYGDHVCNEYTLRYIFACSMFLMMYLIGVLIASDIYMNRFIDKVLDQEETIEWLEEEEYKQSLREANSRPPSAAGATMNKTLGRSYVGSSEDLEVEQSQRSLVPEASSSEQEQSDQLTESALSQMNAATAAANAAANAAASRAAAVAAVNSMHFDVEEKADGADTGVAAVTPGNHERRDSMDSIGETHHRRTPRRLTQMQRAASLRGDNEDAAIAAIHALAATAEGQTARRRMTGTFRMGSIRSDHGDEDHGTPDMGAFDMSSPRPRRMTSVASYRMNSLGGEYVGTMAAVRRMSMHHRMGSLRSETSDKDNQHADFGLSLPGPSTSNRNNNSTINNNNAAGVLGGHANSLHSEAESEMDLQEMNSSNRRWMYVRCLERIMVEEFNFHAKEAKHMSQANSMGGNDSDVSAAITTSAADAAADDDFTSAANASSKAFSPTDISTSPSLLSSFDLSSKSGATSSRKRALSSPAYAISSPDNIKSNNHHSFVSALMSGSQMADSTAGTPGTACMCSNFEMMKELREEMEQARGLHHRNSAGVSLFNIFGHHDLLGSSSKHHSQHHHSAAASDANVAATTNDDGNVAGTSGFSLISGGSQKKTSERKPYVAVKNREVDVESQQQDNSSAAGDASVRSDTHSVLDSRGRSYSLEYDTELQHRPSKKQQQKQRDEQRSMRALSMEDMDGKCCSTAAQAALEEGRHTAQKTKLQLLGEWLWHGIKSITHHVMSALMGHHLGHDESEMTHDEDVSQIEKEFSTIFLFNNAEIYYHAVEFSLLLQCVYVALWATNFVLIAKQSYYPVLWNIALVVPLPINFFVLRQVIFTSAMLKSVVTLDKRVSDKIYEEAVDVQNIKQRVRKVLRHALRSLDVEKEQWVEFTKNQFFNFVARNDRGLNKNQMKLFLHSMQVFLTDQSIERIFTVLDFDRSNRVTWEDIYPVIFPDFVKKQVKVKKRRMSGVATSAQQQQSSDAPLDAAAGVESTRGLSPDASSRTSAKGRRGSSVPMVYDYQLVDDAAAASSKPSTTNNSETRRASASAATAAAAAAAVAAKAAAALTATVSVAVPTSNSNNNSSSCGITAMPVPKTAAVQRKRSVSFQSSEVSSAAEERKAADPYEVTIAMQDTVEEGDNERSDDESEDEESITSSVSSIESSDGVDIPAADTAGRSGQPPTAEREYLDI